MKLYKFYEINFYACNLITGKDDIMSVKKIPIGLELYSVRKTLAQDLEGTLEKVRGFGYDAVEFAGAPQYEATRVAKALADTGLYCSSAHVSYNSLLGSEESFNTTVEYNSVIGNKYLVISSMPHNMLETSDALKQTAEKMNALVEKLSKYGMFTGYHNHNFEFTEVPGTGKTIWSFLRENTAENFLMQIDTGNALKGGADLNSEISKAAGRSQIVHIKPYSYKNEFATMIGDPDDANDYEFIMKFCREKGGTFIYIIEYECETLYTDMKGVELCISALKNKFGHLL